MSGVKLKKIVKRHYSHRIHLDHQQLLPRIQLIIHHLLIILHVLCGFLHNNLGRAHDMPTDVLLGRHLLELPQGSREFLGHVLFQVDRGFRR